MYILLILILSILCMIFYKKFNKEIMSPTVISCILFLFCAVCAYVGKLSWNNVDISFTTVILISAGIAFFGIGELLCRLIYQKFIKNKMKISKDVLDIRNNIKEVKISNIKYIISLLFVFITLVLMFLEVKRVAIACGFVGNSIPEMLAYYRNNTLLFNSNAIESAKISFIVSQMIKVAYIICYVYIYVFINNIVISKKLKTNLKYLLPIVIVFVMSLLSSGRSQLMRFFSMSFIMLMMISSVYYGNKKTLKIFIKFVIIALVTVLPLFYVLMTVVGREEKIDFISYITFYIGCSIPSLELYLNNLPEQSQYWGSETFYGIYFFLGRLKIIPALEAATREWQSFGGIASNVYTSIRRYYQDFGICGVFSLQFIFGFLYSLGYVISKEKIGGIMFLIFGFYSTMIVEQIRDESFFTVIFNTSTIAYVILIVIAYYFLINPIKIKNRRKNE